LGFLGFWFLDDSWALWALEFGDGQEPRRTKNGLQLQEYQLARSSAMCLHLAREHPPRSSAPGLKAMHSPTHTHKHVHLNHHPASHALVCLQLVQRHHRLARRAQYACICVGVLKKEGANGHKGEPPIVKAIGSSAYYLRRGRSICWGRRSWTTRHTSAIP
jgi:hypothetical protein